MVDKPKELEHKQEQGQGQELGAYTPNANDRLNKAKLIRELAAKGLSISAIQSEMRERGIEIRYQHVYNTLKYSRELKNEEEAQKAKKAKLGKRQRDSDPRTPEQQQKLKAALEEAEGKVQKQSLAIEEDLDKFREELKRFVRQKKEGR